MVKRISITIEDKLLEDLDDFVNTFYLEDKGNRSAYITGLIQKYTPKPAE